MMVRMELSRILIRELTDYQIIELREVVGESEGSAGGATPRTFPIVVGLPEAQAIERRLKGITVKRPQTHDLAANLVEAMGGELVSISITDLSEHTFFAALDIRHGGKMLHVDSRPSDAIALGIARDVPIYVAEHVIESATSDEPE